ncbi:CLUMA_CG019026, isoform A [Clunio marinus]|uniref:Mannosyltransferase n=1 Tax=Clunio marinus TaxID=568069 RepID=A0A1J1J3C5_9DIPT|nr:CLUMA_CG019026, isoform A [Clunio marinus]
MSLILFFVALFYCFYTPFTKVEESFNIQAFHDILYHRLNISQYDHHEFPGVVPRTFLGPLVISLTVSPLVALLNFLNVNKFWSQYLVRLTLAAFVAITWNRFRSTLQQKLGIEVSIWFTAITVTQFHFIFYMTRPLPNIMALPLVLLALNSWLRREMRKFLIFAGAAIIIFRAELVILLGLLLIYDLFHQRVTIKELLTNGIPIGLGLVILTVAVDSFFWQRLLWPEAEVLWFNTILNKSSSWGTSPFFWYFYSALPRALGLSLIFVPYGLYAEARIRAITIPALVFVFIYSILPHKELRFIVYVFPMLNIASACACHRLWINRHKTIFHSLLSIAAGGHLIGNFVLTVFLLTVSGTNYPGGVAMSRLHRLASPEANVSIHIDNLTAQSGVTRFTEINSNWTYSKNEHLKAGDDELHKFDYLLTEVKNKYSPEMRILQQTHEKIELIECFSNIGIHYTSLLPIKIRTKPCIMILRRKPNAALLKRFFEVEDPVEGVIADEDNDSTDENESEMEEDVEEIALKPKIRKRLRVTTTTLTPKIKIKEIIAAEKLDTESDDDENLSEEITEKDLLSEEVKEENLSEEMNEEDLSEEENEEIETENLDQVPREHGSGSIKSNIKRIISQEKTKQLIDELKQLDLSVFCDLSKMDTKECLKKILDETNE